MYFNCGLLLITKNVQRREEKEISGCQKLIRKRKSEEERDRNSTKISNYYKTLPSTSKPSSESSGNNEPAPDVVGTSETTSCSGRLGLSLSCVEAQPASNALEDVEAVYRLFQFQVGWFAHPVYSAEGDYPRVMRERIDHISRMEGRRRSRLPSFSLHERQMLAGSADFIGINSYTSALGKANESAGDAGASMHPNPQWPTAAAEWLQVVPSGFRAILNMVAKEYPGYPIFITENGYADLGGIHDTGRVRYIVNYMSEMLKAVYMDNVPVIGYTYWSLMDSYEWVGGFRMKFGLYSVDFEDPDRRRYPKLSARVFAGITKRKHLPQWLNMSTETTSKGSDKASGAVTV